MTRCEGQEATRRPGNDGARGASASYLPEHRAFLRWLAADSEADLAAAEAVLADPASQWETCGTGATDGPAVLMDSATAGAGLGVEFPAPTADFPSRRPYPCPSAHGRYGLGHARPDARVGGPGAAAAHRRDLTVSAVEYVRAARSASEESSSATATQPPPWSVRGWPGREPGPVRRPGIVEGWESPARADRALHP
ncbi:Imm21 family immunity protein [Streptomyces sp. NPDC001389]|uniref:Imm21 family immunity protein n=1 Tax=unclassified Streptomyces TaxID=2593676 RepID=UPI0036D04454